MASFKSNIKPRNKSMYKIVSRRTKFEISKKSEVADGTSVEIEVEDSIRISDDGFEFDCVNEGFTHCD